MAEKKVVITNQEWCDLMNHIHRGNYCLTQEAQKLGISLKELIAMGDEAHKGKGNERWQEWCQTKRESSKKDKIMARPRKMRKPATTSVPAPTPAPEPPATATAPAPTNASTPTPTPARVPASTPTAPADPMEELLRKMEEFQRKLAECESSLEAAKAILDIRQEALANANAVLEKAKHAVQQAEAEEAEAKAAVKQAQAQQHETQAELQGIEKEIQDLKEKTIYLVDPWFTGELPKYGTFLSTVEMEGVTLQEVHEDYLPEASLDGVLLFDFVPDYKKARVFCGLVAQFELEETPYNLLVSDERVKELLKMYIGK